MAKVMKASEFVKKLKDVSSNYNTLYVMGCFGAPMTPTNKKRYTSNHEYNMRPNRTKLINAASSDTFGFDCVGLIKGILWGWAGDKSKTYGGAKYKANSVADLSADGMIKTCSNISTDFSKIEIGEAVWTTGHIGVYIGDGLAIECTPSWKNKVQITACNCKKTGYSTRNWKKHGKLPYIDYDEAEVSSKKPSATTKVDAAKNCDKTLTGSYRVTASVGLNIRAGASTKKASLGVLKHGTVVRNYGYYSIATNGVKWLYVATDDGVVGFCSSTYLKKI